MSNPEPNRIAKDRRWVLLSCKTTATIALISLFAGCSAPPPNTGMEKVQHYFRERTSSRFVLHEEPFEQAIQNLLDDKLTPEEAVQIALLKNPSLQARLEELNIAYADLVQAGLLSNPVFAVSARFPDRPPSATNTSFSVTQNFLDILVTPLRKKIAGLQFEEIQMALALEILHLAADVRYAYFSLQGDYHSLTMQENLLKESEAQLELAQLQYKSGNINELELILFQKTYQKAQIRVMETQSQILEQKVEFCRLTGLDRQEVDGIIPQMSPEMLEIDFTLDQLQAMALSTRLDLSMAHKKTELIQEAIAVTKQDVFGFINVGVDTEREMDRTVVTGPTLSLEAPVFDRKQAAITRKNAQLRQSQKQAEAIKQSILLDVWAAFHQFRSKAQIAKYYQTSVIGIQQRTMALSENYYNNMLIGPYTLLSAQREEMEARLEYADILTECRLAYIQLENAVGKTLRNQDMPTPNEHQGH